MIKLFYFLMRNQQINLNTGRKEYFINMNSSQNNQQQQQINENYRSHENYFNNQQQQQNNFYSLTTQNNIIGNKRQLNEENLNQEEKENCGIPFNKRPYLDNQKALFENEDQINRSGEEDIEDEEEEDEEEVEEESGESSGGIDLTKIDNNLPECSIKQEQNLSSFGINIKSNYGQQQQQQITTNIYSTPQQHSTSQQYIYNNNNTSTTSAFTNFGMIPPSAPIAHSTPIIGQSYNNTFNSNTLKNFQQVALGYLGQAAALPTIRSLPINQYNFSNIQSSSQNFQLASYGGYGGYHGYPHQMFSNKIFTPQMTSPLNNSSSFSIGRDSGVGGINKIIKDIQKSGSSSGGSSEESALSVKTGQSIELIHKEPKFPPYMSQITLDGYQQYRDLEEIFFDKPIPARLSLLNSNKKYPITLAEIHRRLNPPECLNTSYLSGILRRAKNKNGGNKLRMELGKYDCGLHLQTGKRKSSQVTTISALCEGEAIQVAEDFNKSVKDQQNGFPFEQIAKELIRRSSPEMRNKNIDDANNLLELLREAISIVEIATEQETLPLVPLTGEVINQQQYNNIQHLMPETLNQSKRFGRAKIFSFTILLIVLAIDLLLQVGQHFLKLFF
ncbi:hypothetical protein Mgra_00000458 [Meloidogyne graminicola]|uniref:Transcription factor AP-2 C-terminal domain-containing protein n=1 Tax=Meloidogyne graminicola TaxID=189291 RepID=A0A8T0A509_9BILA|nr:hypothetical protein Mgra_00000458 [Meloidogyne graminicola]